MTELLAIVTTIAVCAWFPAVPAAVRTTALKMLRKGGGSGEGNQQP